MSVTLYTIGHSNRDLDTFVDLLQAHDIERLADVRRFPSSRRLPQFNRDALASALAEGGIGYAWFEELGGRRSGFKEADSPNLGLRVHGFRQYADYMQTAPFQEAAEALFDRAASHPTALMCAEAVYWRCHRRLISDYAIARGHHVYHIMDRQTARPHRLTDVAQITKGQVIYPGPLFQQQGSAGHGNP